MQALVRTRGGAAAGAMRRPSPPAPAASKLAGGAGVAMKIGTSIPAASKHYMATTVVTMVTIMHCLCAQSSSCGSRRCICTSSQ